MSVWEWTLLAVVTLSVAVIALTRWGMHWGASRAERRTRMPGDAYLDDGPRARVAMTRAVSLSAPAETVWPWLAQMGRGAGWYSWDRLDNGARPSARHIVSWIPEPAIGDAAAIGYLRAVVPERQLTWWLPGVTFFRARSRAVVDIQLQAEGEGSRVVIRMAADASGVLGWPALAVFCVIDSIMAVRQMRGIRQRVEAFGARPHDPDAPETGDRSQYQHYEVFYASGERAGARGQEHAEQWRRAAISDGVLDMPP